MVRYTPVSYTHLDVYKRQLYNGVLPHGFGVRGLVVAGIIPIDLLTQERKQVYKSKIEVRYCTSSQGGHSPYYGSVAGKMDQ